MIWVHVCMHVHVCGHMYVFTGRYICMCISMWEGSRLTYGTFNDCSQTYSVFPLSPKFADRASIADQIDPGTPSFCLLSAEIINKPPTQHLHRCLESKLRLLHLHSKQFFTEPFSQSLEINFSHWFVSSFWVCLSHIHIHCKYSTVSDKGVQRMGGQINRLSFDLATDDRLRRLWNFEYFCFTS